MMEAITTKDLRSIIAHLNSSNKAFVQIPRPILRGMLTELLRLLEAQNMKDCERAVLIQCLTMEYACAHICDLLNSLIDADVEDGLYLNEAINFAVDQIQEMANKIKVKPRGQC